MKTSCLHFAFPGLANIGCVFSARLGEGLEGNISYLAGGSEAKVTATRKELFGALDGLLRIAECRQVHGDALVEARKDWQPSETLPEADGMMTCEDNLGLMIKTADCQPILIAHRSGKYILAIHAGWRGNRANFPQSAVERFCEKYALAPHDLFAVRGPSLGPACARFENFGAEWPPQFLPWYDKKGGCMDLWALTRHQLNMAGLPHSQIYGVDLCTLANSGQFFSYRADRTRGRQAAIIWRKI